MWEATFFGSPAFLHKRKRTRVFELVGEEEKVIDGDKIFEVSFSNMGLVSCSNMGFYICLCWRIA